MAFGEILLAGYSRLSRSGSQSQRTIWFILPARGAGHIINTYNVDPYLSSVRLPCRSKSVCTDEVFVLWVCPWVQIYPIQVKAQSTLKISGNQSAVCFHRGWNRSCATSQWAYVVRDISSISVKYVMRNRSLCSARRKRDIEWPSNVSAISDDVCHIYVIAQKRQYLKLSNLSPVKRRNFFRILKFWSFYHYTSTFKSCFYK